ncbi:MAG: Sec-independent protein translocase protein TatB [Casimicrobiaceae bacterium]
MFDIGFSEIVLIAVVALVVLGPERLPKAARTMGLLFGRLQRYVNEVKADISREMELDELRKLQSEMQGAARDLQQTVANAASDVATGVRNVERELNESGTDTVATATPEPAASPVAASIAPVAAERATLPTAAAVPPEPPRQAALPGFEKI